MSEGTPAGRGSILPIEMNPAAGNQRLVEIVSSHINASSPPQPNGVPTIRTDNLPDVQQRKVTPYDVGLLQPANRPTVTNLKFVDSHSKVGAFFARLVNFFSGGGKPDRLNAGFIKVAPNNDVRKANTPGTENGEGGLSDAIDRLEKSQEFATGLTLMSSLTQSVMSSSRRLTQGQ